MENYFECANEELNKYMEGARSDMGMLWSNTVSMVFDPSNNVSPSTSAAESSSQSSSLATPPIPVAKGHRDSKSQTIKIVMVDGVMQTDDLCCLVCGSENIIVKPERPRQNTTSTVSSDVLEKEKTENVVSVTSPVYCDDEGDCGSETRDLKSDTLTTEQKNIPPTYTVPSPLWVKNKKRTLFCLQENNYVIDRTARKRAHVDDLSLVNDDCETPCKKRRIDGSLSGPLSEQYLHESDPNLTSALPAYAYLASTLPRPVNHSRTYQVNQTMYHAPTSPFHPSSSTYEPHTITLSNSFYDLEQTPTSADTEGTEHNESQAMDCLPAIKQEPINTLEPSMQEFTQLYSTHEHQHNIYESPLSLFSSGYTAATEQPIYYTQATTHHNTDHPQVSWTPARQFNGYMPPWASCLNTGSLSADGHSQQITVWEEDECDMEVDQISDTYEVLKEISGDETTIYTPVTPSATTPDTYDHEETVPAPKRSRHHV